MSQVADLMAAMQAIVELAELADRLSQAQERFDTDTIEALCEKNRVLRPQLSQAMARLEGFVPQSAEERELMALAQPLVQKIRHGDRAFAVWQGNLGTMRAWSSEATNQALRNATHLCDAPPVDILDDQFRGVPAILVAAGPSLDKNFHLLEEVADRAVIITMNRCAAIFQAENLRPHLLVASDLSDILPDTHFRDIRAEVLENVVLRPSVHPRMMNLPSTRTFLFTDGSAHETGLLEAMGKPARPVGGGTVAHSCFQLAYHMGCDPVIVIGQDLAYDKTRAYSSRDLDADKHIAVLGDGDVAELHDGDGNAIRIAGRTGTDFQLETVPGWGGGEVLTSLWFRRFIEFYELMVDAQSKVSGQTFINATEGGARISGMQEMTFREAIDRHVTQPVAGIRERIATIHHTYRSPVDAEMMQETMRQLERQMVRLDNLVGDGSRLTQGTKRNERRLQRVQEIRTRAGELFTAHEPFLRDAYRGALSQAATSEDVWEQLEAEFGALRTAVQGVLTGCREALR